MDFWFHASWLKISLSLSESFLRTKRGLSPIPVLHPDGMPEGEYWKSSLDQFLIFIKALNALSLINPVLSSPEGDNKNPKYLYERTISNWTPLR